VSSVIPITMAIEARGVSVALGGRTVVCEAELVAPAGAVTVIVGPNGSGKTTLLRALSGELSATGLITLNGEDARRLRPHQLAARRAVLPQASALAFPFTVQEIVRLGLTCGYSGRGEGDRIAAALAAVDLEGYAGRFYQELSGGEKQRVQLARVLVQVWEPVVDGRPRYLLLDEPVAALDIRHQLGLMDVARRYADGGGGVLAVLHDLNLAAMFADRIVMMKAGRSVAAGAARTVLTDERVSHVFDCALRIGHAPADRLFVLPQSARPDNMAALRT